MNKNVRYVILSIMLYSTIIQAQIVLPSNYDYKISYEETKTIKYIVEDLDVLTELDKLNVMGEKQIKNVTNYEVNTNESYTHIEYRKQKEGWWKKIDEMLITPTHIHSRIGKSYRNNEKNRRQGLRENSDLTLIERIKMPVITQKHINDLNQNNVDHFTTPQGVTIIRTSDNSSLEIDGVKKKTKEVRLLNVDGLLSSVERQNYYLPIISDSYTDSNNQTIFSEENPLWMPYKISIEEPITLPSGACAIKKIVLERVNIILEGNVGQGQNRINKSSIADWNPAVSPNPVEDKLKISDLENLDGFTLDVYDGFYNKLSVHRNNHVLDVSELSPGLYYILLQTKGANRTLKFIKL